MGNGNNVKKGFFNNIRAFLASVKFAVLLFSLISLASLVGTLILQQAEPAENMNLLAKVFGMSGAHTAYAIIHAAGFTDLFNTWWFLALLFLFAANLAVCSLERLPGIIKITRERMHPLPEERFTSLAPNREATIKTAVDEAGRRVLAALRAMGFKGSLKTEQGLTQIFAEKGRYSRLGVYITHLSILVILLGAVIGMRYGFKGTLTLLEGASSSVAYDRKDKEFRLGFEVRCDDFDVAFYPESQTPKSYKSRLTVLENEREIATKEIEVNKPLHYKGITFYQSNYGYHPSRDSLFKFRVTTADGKTQELAAKFNEPFPIPGAGMSAKVIDFSPALALNASRELVTFAEVMMNPAALVEFSKGGVPASRQWILRDHRETWNSPAGAMEFRDFWGAQFTGLQVKKDPGVWLVYLGCLLMTLGLYTAFFMSHRRIWILLREGLGTTRIAVVSACNKNKVTFDLRLDAFLHELEQEKNQRDRGGK